MQSSSQNLSKRRWDPLPAAALLAAGLLEALAAAIAPPPGGPAPLGLWCAGWITLGALGALGGAWPRLGRWLPALGAAVLWPHAARIAGLGTAAPWLALPALALGRVPRRGAWGVLVLSALLPALALPRPADGPPGVGAGPDRVLITVDTVRADHVPAAPPGWSAQVGVAAAPWTLPSVLSLMLGAPPSQHGGGLPTPSGSTLPAPGGRWLAETLGPDTATAAFVCNPHLRADLGFGRGFDRFEHSDDWVEPSLFGHTLYAWRRRLLGRVERLRRERDERLAAAALGWWARTPGPRFLWVHLLGPHEHRRELPADTAPEALRAAYAAAVTAGWERALALAAALDDAEVVVLTSDHGESLGEGGRWGHGTALDAAQLEVPLWTRGVPTAPGEGRVPLTAVAAALRGEAPLQPQATVEVGALRRLPDQAGLWGVEGLRPLPPPPATGPAWTPDAVQAERLRQLGYH